MLVDSMHYKFTPKQADPTSDILTLCWACYSKNTYPKFVVGQSNIGFGTAKN